MLERPQDAGLDDAARRGLRRYRRHALVLLAVGALLFVAFTWLTDRTRDRADELQHDGARVPGVVIGTCGCGEGGSVTARYLWDASARTTTVRLNARSRRYHVGDEVVVLVDRSDAGHVTLLGEKNESSTVVLIQAILLITAGFALVISTWSLLRGRRQRRLLEAHCWRTVRVRWTARRRSGSLPELAVETDDGRWQRVRLLATTVWRLKGSNVRGATELQVADDGSRRAVVRAPGSSAMISARLRDSFLAADTPTIDPTRPSPDPKQVRRILRFQLVGASVMGVLAIFTWSQGSTVPSVFYAIAAAATLYGRHRIARRAHEHRGDHDHS